MRGRNGRPTVPFSAGHAELFAFGMLCALVAASSWVFTATYLCLAVSTTHSVSEYACLARASLQVPLVFQRCCFCSDVVFVHGSALKLIGMLDFASSQVTSSPTLLFSAPSDLPV
jgi:hypothetical protein